MDPLREWYTNVSCWATASGYLELQFQNRRNLGLQQAWFDLSRFEHIFAFLYLFQNHVHRISAVNRKNFGTSFTTRCFEVPKMGNCCMVEDCRFALTSLSRSNRVLWYTYAICIHICFVFFKLFSFVSITRTVRIIRCQKLGGGRERNRGWADWCTKTWYQLVSSSNRDDSVCGARDAFKEGPGTQVWHDVIWCDSRSRVFSIH